MRREVLKIILVIGILIVALQNFSYANTSVEETTPNDNIISQEYITAQFEDINFFNAVRGLVGNSEIDEENLTISANQEEFEAVKEIDIPIPQPNRQIQNITGIEYFTKINTIKLPYNDITDITPLENLTDITTLELSGNEIENLEPIKKLENLKILELSYLNLTDITALENLINLEELNLKGNTKIDNIDSLANLENLKILDLSNLLDLKHITPLQNLQNLETLKAPYCKINDISPLANLTNLTNLELDNNNIRDISPLKNLVKLKTLDLSNNEIYSINSLNNLTEIEVLNLHVNNIKDISSLKELIKLEELDLGKNLIENIEELKYLIKLYQLKLNDNKISNIEVLKNLSNLTDLNLKYNKIEDIISIVKGEFKVVEIPQIMQEVYNEDSMIYSEEEMELENCTWKEKGKTIEIDTNLLEEDSKIKITVKGGETLGTTYIASINYITLENIEIKSLPNKLEYKENEEVNTEGLTLIATYSDGSTKEVNNGFECLNSILTNIGTEEVVITYKEGEKTVQAKFFVNVSCLEHDLTESTCEEEAKCQKEGCTYIEASLGHDYGEWEEVKEATCTEKGEEERICSRCTKSETREIETLGHDYGEWEELKEATCTEKGEEERICSRCTKSETREIETLGHDYGEWEEVKEATCTETGEEERICSRCTKSETREIEALGHKYEENNCTKCGKTILVETSNYSIEETHLKGITPDTIISELLNNIISELKILIMKDNKEITEGKIGTGMNIKILEKGLEINTWTAIVDGDTNGDGESNVKDMIKINNYRLYGTTEGFGEIYMKASDVNKDGKTDIKDMVVINNYRLYGTSFRTEKEV